MIRRITETFALLAGLAVATGAATGAERAVDYTTAALVDGFVHTVFGVEAYTKPNPATQRVKRWHPDGLRVAIVNVAKVDREAAVKAFVTGLPHLVPALAARVVDKAAEANMVVYLVDRADFRDVIRRTMPAGHDTRFMESNDCTAVTGGPDPLILSLAFVYIVADQGDGLFRHCLVEETLQSLGPVNDSRTLKNSIFNDYSDVADLTRFDWYIVSMLFDPRVKPGMTKAEVRKILPAVVEDLRPRAEALAAEGVFGAR